MLQSESKQEGMISLGAAEVLMFWRRKIGLVRDKIFVFRLSIWDSQCQKKLGNSAHLFSLVIYVMLEGSYKGLCKFILLPD